MKRTVGFDSTVRLSREGESESRERQSRVAGENGIGELKSAQLQS